MGPLVKRVGPYVEVPAQVPKLKAVKWVRLGPRSYWSPGIKKGRIFYGEDQELK